jgi:hypothetical protein
MHVHVCARACVRACARVRVCVCVCVCVCVYKWGGQRTACELRFHPSTVNPRVSLPGWLLYLLNHLGSLTLVFFKKGFFCWPAFCLRDKLPKSAYREEGFTLYPSWRRKGFISSYSLRLKEARAGVESQA